MKSNSLGVMPNCFVSMAELVLKIEIKYGMMKFFFAPLVYRMILVQLSVLTNA